MIFDSVRLLTIIGVLFFTALGISAPLITLYFEELGASYAHISLLLASFAATSLLSNYIWGQVSDKLGRRKPLIIGGLLGLSAAYALLSQASTANWAGMAWVLNGAFGAAYITPSLALMGDLLAVGGKRGQRMGSYRGMGSLAFAFGAIIGGRVADQYSLTVTFRLCVLFYLLAVLCALALREERKDSSVTPIAEPSAPKATSPQKRLPVAFLMGVFLWITAHTSSAAMWPNFMATLGYSKTSISSLWGLAAFVEAPTMYAVGSLSDAIGRVPLLAAGGIGVALVMLGYITLAHILPALAGVQVIRGFAFASYTTTAMTFTTEWGDRDSRGTHSGLFNAVTGAGQLFGLLISGTLAQAMGFEFLFALCAVTALLSSVCFWHLRWSEKTNRKA